MIQLKLANSLQKLWNEDLPAQVCGKLVGFQNEVLGIQLAVKNTGVPADCRFEIRSALPITMRKVGYVPGEFTYHPDSDDYVIAKDLHLFPDPLIPFDEKNFVLKGNCVNVFWITAGNGESVAAGEYRTEISLMTQKGDLQGQISFEICVMKGELPATDLAVTDWLHYDCICNYYHIRPFGKKFWELTGTFIGTAVRHGINTVYVPLFTPPLDTQVGGERTTVQLIDIKKEGNKYNFNFSRLEKFLSFAEMLGVRYFEFSHLFTQWGAQAAPKIVAEEDGKTKKIFGWETKADGAEYTAFLESFLPQLGAFLEKKGLKERAFIHISDEPSEYWLKDYTARRVLIKRLLPDFTHIDALSEIAFLEKGLIDIPVAATDSAEQFAKSGREYWVYYCFPQCRNYLSNRMMNMPSERTRIIGMQLYRNGAKGFLHWGYNFYNTALSRRSVDPFFETDAGGSFQSGDSFIVYPGEKGAIDSLRLESFREGMQDYRALLLLEKYAGREKVLAFLHEEGIDGFTQYPHGHEKFLAVRQKLNELIADCMK